MTDTDSKTMPTDTGPRFQTAIETEAPCVRRVTVRVDPAALSAARRREARKLAKTVRIKGFRKGKVPPHVLEERYGETIDERTLTALLNEGFREAVLEHTLQPVGEPAVDHVDYRPGERLSFTIDVEVMPEIELAHLGGFRLRRPEVTVEEADVDELLERMRGERAVLEPVDRPPATGDVVSVMIRPVEGSEEDRKPYRFELGAGYAIPDVEAAILTLTPGEAGTFEVTYPEDFANEKLAGTTRALEIELSEVKAKRLPELDDEFAREVGEFDTLEALRAAIREDVVRHREEEAEGAVREQLIDAILEANPFEVPPGLVSRYLDRVLDAPDDADPERLAEARRSVAPAVERQLKRDLVLDQVIETEGLRTTAEELQRRLETIAERHGLSVSEVRQRLAREKRLDSLRREMAEEKAFALLMERSEIE